MSAETPWNLDGKNRDWRPEAEEGLFYGGNQRGWALHDLRVLSWLKDPSVEIERGTKEGKGRGPQATGGQES